MQYKIHTAPIWDAFRVECECPLCNIQKDVSSNLVSHYLNEAVMEPIYRIEVNKYGFCTKHLTDLYNNENKLGFALQINTHTNELINKLDSTQNYKQAKKESQKIQKLNAECAVCRQAEGTMIRYYETTAQLFKNEKEFALLLKNIKGFCLKHYACLLEHSSYAGAAIEQYLKTLFLVQKTQQKRLNSELETFIDSFDHQKKNNTNVAKAPKDALPRAINKLRGEIITETKNKE